MIPHLAARRVQTGDTLLNYFLFFSFLFFIITNGATPVKYTLTSIKNQFSTGYDITNLDIYLSKFIVL